MKKWRRELVIVGIAALSVIAIMFISSRPSFTGAKQSPTSKHQSEFSGESVTRISASHAEFYGINLAMSDDDFFKVVQQSNCKDITSRTNKADQFAGITQWECDPKHKVIKSIEVAFMDKKILHIDFLFSGRFSDLEESHRAILAKFNGKIESPGQFGHFGEHNTVISSCTVWSGGVNDCTTLRWKEDHSFIVLYSHEGDHSLGVTMVNRDDSMVAELHAAYKRYDEKQNEVDRKAASDLGF